MKIEYRHTAVIRLQMIKDWGTYKFSSREATQFVSKLIREIRELSKHPNIGKTEVNKEGIEIKSFVIHPYFKVEYIVDSATQSMTVFNIIDVREDPSL